jgi:outer membrane protein insertion porin family
MKIIRSFAVYGLLFALVTLAQPVIAQPVFGQAGFIQARSSRQATAQTQPNQTEVGQKTINGPLEQILIEGTDDEVLKGRIKITIDIEIGNLAENVQPQVLQQQVLELGLFREVTVEVSVKDGQNTLLIRVKVNPKIASLEIVGKDINLQALKSQLLEGQLNIAPGVLLDNVRLEEGRSKIAQVYRQYVYPFVPNVKLEVSPPDADDSVKVTYSVDATASLKSLRVTGESLVPKAQIEAAFGPVLDKASFDASLYGTAIARVGALYEKLGYRGSGISLASSELVDGVLNIVITEVKIVAIDATQLGLEPEQLALKVGDFFNYDTLLANIRQLNSSRQQQVGLKLEQPSEDGVIVTLTLEEAAASPINTIRFEGNTAIPSQQLIKGFKQHPGDVFNALASQEDLTAVAQAYTAAGFLLAVAPEMVFLDGVYSIRVLEVRVIGYEIKWQNATHRTQDPVILRELPAPGLYSAETIRSSLKRINSLEIIDPQSLGNIGSRTPNPDKPEEIVLILNFQEANTILLEPQIGYSSRPGDGWSGTIRLTETNLFGLNNRLSLSFSAQPNPNAANWFDGFSGSLSYTIPWIDLELFDLRNTRTPISFTVYSRVQPALVIPGQNGVNAKPNGGNERTYLTRDSGFSLSLSRAIDEHFAVRFGIGFAQQNQSLETGEVRSFNPNLQNDALAQALLATQVPNSSTVTTFAEGSYSSRNDANFPTAGLSTQGSVSYSVGSEGNRALSYLQVNTGLSTYLGFGFDPNGEFGLGENRNMALAFRINGGALLGEAPRNAQYRVGDIGGNESLTLRGYNNGDLSGDVYYSGSLEYRYDFGLKTSFSNALLGVLFLDAANAWGNAGPRPQGIGDGLQFGYGLGAQINLQFGAFNLPPLGFYYGWSPSNPGGRFHFVFSFRF